MLTIPYLAFETFKNYTLLGDTYLSSPCILSKVMMLNVFTEVDLEWKNLLYKDLQKLYPTGGHIPI